MSSIMVVEHCLNKKLFYCSVNMSFVNQIEILWIVNISDDGGVTG